MCVCWGVALVLSSGVCAQGPKPAPAKQSKTPAAVGGQQVGATRSPHGKMSLHCEDCHTFTSWKPIRSIPEFDHNKTSFPLRGLHEKVECRLCHTSLVFTNAGNQCADCHADIHRGQFGASCDQCHTVKGWKVSLASVRQHDNRFPLLGAHARLDCAQCHTSAAVGRFAGLATECMSCHQNAFQRAANPDHKAAGFPTTCETCHTMDGWPGVRFDHARYAGFALTGAHAQLACSTCHVGGRYRGTPANCFGCHATDFQNATNPNHVAANFPQDCALCHNTATWQGANFDHSKTLFPLTGAHAAQVCSACHINGKYTGLSTACVSCHLSNFNSTTNPNHVTAGIPQTCAVCHSTAAWMPATFDHNLTRFPLTGAHASAACAQCHVNGRYTGTPTTCSSCHLSDFQKTTSPNHVTSGFPTDCTVCHTTAAWQPSSFDHSKSAFPLTGAHISASCSSCHINGRYVGTPKNCDSCHLPDFQKTTNPNHAAAGFPTDCSICHSTVQWLGAKFDHSKTKFPLTGMHASQSCSACHASGVFVGLSTACSSCHLNAFNNTTNPNHKTAGFPTDCSVCHNTAAWVPSSFNHSLTRFPLTGKHTTTPCASCHIGGQYAGTPSTCYSCHRADFQKTTSPNHTAANFPTTCDTCHTTSTWLGATFSHTQFPIYSGAHAGKWTTCADCHTNPANFQVFSCLTCHEHNKTSMDSKHQGIRNYVYNSTNCYSCHPQGRAN